MTDSFIAKLNIERFRDLLTSEKDEVKRHVLEKLLADAEVALEGEQRAADESEG